jgi:hypothetical protein
VRFQKENNPALRRTVEPSSSSPSVPSSSDIIPVPWRQPGVNLDQSSSDSDDDKIDDSGSADAAALRIKSALLSEESGKDEA